MVMPHSRIKSFVFISCVGYELQFKTAPPHPLFQVICRGRILAGDVAIRKSYPNAVSHKSIRIAAMVEALQGQELDARYLGYFHCFNRQEFYEAHDVLEDLWLPDRYGPNGDFYKGLIQLAGAFVHLQKNRLRPSAALFKLAQANFEKYPDRHERLNLAAVQLLIMGWLVQLEKGEFQTNPLTSKNVPQLALQVERM